MAAGANGDDENTRRAAAHLRRLLEEHPPYVERWRVHARQATQLNQSAVARVLAAHLWDTGEADERDVDVPRRLKDLVSRALAGRNLSARTLTWFVEAFDMNRHDAGRLWALRLGTGHKTLLPVVRGHARPPEPQLASRHRTLSLHEVHVVGKDGLPSEHRTIQVIQATAPLDRYPFRVDTDVVAVHVVRGGRATGLRLDALPGLYAVDIELTRPLSVGDTAVLEYATTFAYRSPPPPEFRRAAYRRVDAVEIAVRFHPARLPQWLEWCAWGRHDDRDPVSAEPVDLDPDHGAHRYLATIENATVGFRWSFPEPDVTRSSCSSGAGAG